MGGIYFTELVYMSKTFLISRKFLNLLYIQYFLRFGISKLTPNTNAPTQSDSINCSDCNILVLK